MVLPPIADKTNRLQRVVAFGFFSWLIYTLGLHFHFGVPKFFPLTNFELGIPFEPVSIWAYVLLYPFNVVTFFLYQEDKTLNHIGWGFILLQVFAFFVFMFYPVAYPIHFYPLPSGDSLSLKLFEFIRFMDRPVNCFPSLHVANSYMVAFGFVLENRKMFVPWFLIATVIALSTLTTKQHYFLDILFGFFLALSIFFIMFWLLKDFKPLHNHGESDTP